MPPTPRSQLTENAEDVESDRRLLTRANVAGPVMMIGRAILVAVIILIVLGQLYATSIVAEPWDGATPTDTVTENQTISASGSTTVNVSDADWYYDDGENAETVVNASDDTALTEGTDYEFYTNGTLENLDSSEVTMEITYSYFTENSFQALTATFAEYGEIAYIMVGLGLIALGASVALSYFGGFSSGGRGGR